LDLGAIVTDTTKHFGPDSYSGVIFLSSTPFRSWDRKVDSGKIDSFGFSITHPTVYDITYGAERLVETFTSNPEKVPPETVFAWTAAYISWHPSARINHSYRAVGQCEVYRHEKALREAGGKIPTLVILGKEDKFLLVNKVEKLYREAFTGELVEIQIWPGVGHLPFYEEPEKTRDAILEFVRKVQDECDSVHSSPTCCSSELLSDPETLRDALVKA